MTSRLKDKLSTFLFLSPWLILFVIFSIYPLFFSIIVSLSKYSGLNPRMEFVGFSNYIKAFHDEVFLIALKNTFLFVVGTIPFTTAISLFLAILINDRLLPMREFFQAGFFLPSVVSMVVISLIWLYLYSAEGPFNMIMEKMIDPLKKSVDFFEKNGFVSWIILYLIVFFILYLLDLIFTLDEDTRKNRIAVYGLSIPVWSASHFAFRFLGYRWIILASLITPVAVFLVDSLAFSEKLKWWKKIYLTFSSVILWELMVSISSWIQTVITNYTEKVSFLAKPETALPSIMFMDVWGAIGYYTILFIAGLRSIPDEIYEAAKIDGANRWQVTFRITLPLLKPTLFFIIAINTIRSFQIFTEIFTMTGGGPRHSTETIVHYLYNVGFRRFEMGYASAIAYILFGIVMVITLVQKRLLRSDI
jgi:ABC-type sugar transport system permease subunit